MEMQKRIKRVGAWALACAVLFLYAGHAYAAGKAVGGLRPDAVLGRETETEAAAESAAESIAEAHTEEKADGSTKAAESAAEPVTEAHIEKKTNESAKTAEESAESSEKSTEKEEDMKSVEESTESEKYMEPVEKDTGFAENNAESTENDTEPAKAGEPAGESLPDAVSGQETETDTSSGEETKTDAGSGEETEPDVSSGEETETDAGSGEETEPDVSSGEETETDAAPGEETETETEPQSETILYNLEEGWQDGPVRRAGETKIRSAEQPRVKRDESLLLTCLDATVYVKYVLNHGMDIGDKTLLAYCLYNTKEGPADKRYVPDGSGSFSKEITYCLYNGSRYKGRTCHNSRYSTGDWKRDYYLTQIAIHLVNHRQGRESSIEGRLNRARDTEVYDLAHRMAEDAFADQTTVSSATNQTREVNYRITPDAQSDWKRQEDGSWRTVKNYRCASSHEDRIVSVRRELAAGAPDGVSIKKVRPNDRLSPFYLKATHRAFTEMVREQLTVTVKLTVKAQEYGCWWYVPAEERDRWQDITYLALEAVGLEKKPAVRASASEQYCAVTLRKKDAQTQGALRGAVYGLYEDAGCSALAAQFPPTGSDGTARLEVPLSGRNTYYIREISAPSGYCMDTQVHRISIRGQTEAAVDLWDQARLIRLRLVKTDRETGQGRPQGDASLAGAVYGLYAREPVIHPDGVTGAVLAKDAQAALLQTDETGTAFAENLFPGQYSLRELTPPPGYQRDEAVHELTLSAGGGTEAVVERTVTVADEVKKQGFQLIKDSGRGDQAPPLPGAGFRAWLCSALPLDARGNYVTDGAAPAVIGPGGETELFTDQNGYLCTVPLPFGTYLVRETTVPANHRPVEDFLVTISEHSPQTPQPWRILLDESLMARLRIVKKDRESGGNVLIPGTEFRIVDLATGKPVEQTTAYPEYRLHRTYFTDGEGTLTLPEELPPGRYGIEEVTAPDGYTVSAQMIEFELNEESACQVDPQTGSLLIEQSSYNNAVTGRIEITKTGEVPEGYGTDFTYRKAPLAGVTFEILAEEDIVSPDGRRDGQGPLLLYPRGSLVAEATTDGHGRAKVEGLRLGTYRVREKQAPFGFVADRQGTVVRLAYEDQETPVVSAACAFENQRQRLRVLVRKQDADSGQPLADAEFGLYAAEEIRGADGALIAEADVCLGTCLTDESGAGRFALDLPHGRYYIKEERAPAGYEKSGERWEADLRACDGTTPEIQKEITAENVRAKEPALSAEPQTEESGKGTEPQTEKATELQTEKITEAQTEPEKSTETQTENGTKPQTESEKGTETGTESQTEAETDESEKPQKDGPEEGPGSGPEKVPRTGDDTGLEAAVFTFLAAGAFLLLLLGKRSDKMLL